MTATKLTQVGVEVLWDPATNTKLTQAGVEVLWVPGTVTKLTQAGVEVLYTLAPRPQRMRVMMVD